ncbi:MAG: hypothetical protein ICV72_15355, partial [Aldersonia sp.]|nr:hypothetical protein [Aldersonia sp.]
MAGRRLRGALAAVIVLTTGLSLLPPAAVATASERAPAVFYAQPTGRSVRFLWIEPDAGSYDHMVIRQRSGDNPIMSPTAGSKVFSGRGTSYDWSYRYTVVRELENNTTYSFAAFAYNEAGDVTWSDHWELQANDTTGPLYPKPSMNHNFSGTKAVEAYWQNPPDADLAKVVVLLKREHDEDFVVRHTVNNPVPGDRHHVRIDGLDHGESVMVRFDAFDDAGRFWDWSGVGLMTLRESRIRFAMSDENVPLGGNVRLVGHLEMYETVDDQGWLPLFNRRVTLHRRAYGTEDWTYVAEALTEEAEIGDPRQGRVVFEVEPQANTEYQMRFAGDGAAAGTPSTAAFSTAAAGYTDAARTRSRIRAALVRAKVRAHAVDDTVRAGDPVVVRGTVDP